MQGFLKTTTWGLSFIEVEARFPGAAYPDSETFRASELGFRDSDLIKIEGAQGRAGRPRCFGEGG